MKTSEIVGCIVILIIAVALLVTFAPQNEESINVYQLSNSSLHIQCEDEHEPVVTKLANSTEIVVICEAR